ncbi:MAG: hypothetical protein ABFS35_02470 [Bacteroidota bacterium]
MDLDFNSLLALGLFVAVIFLVIKLITKSAFRVFGIAVIAVVGLGYLYFYTDYFEEHQDNKIVQTIEKHINVVSLKEFEAKHCKGSEMTRSDSIQCECIVQPLLKDLRSKYSEKELDELLTNKDQYLKELLAALNRNRETIIKKLKEKKAVEFWNKMMKNLKKGKFLVE